MHLSRQLGWPVSVLVPAFGAAEFLHDCLESLALYLPPSCDVHVLDDATPDGSVARVAGDFVGRISDLSYVRRPENIGFIANCNLAIAGLLESGRDILLLNSDARITPGTVEEMFSVLHLYEKHGAVTPRSNNATIFSVPLFERWEPADSYALWQQVRDFLPRYQIVPTCSGFCMLVRNIVFRHFGLFDPIYTPGYNEENDLVCRMNRHGYSAVAANRAFAFHAEASSFGYRRAFLEPKNRSVLDERYPEYARSVDQYLRHCLDPVDRFAIFWSKRRQRILVDLYSLLPEHSGTSEFALSLLLHLAPLLESKYDLSIGISDEAREFFAGDLMGYRVLSDPEQERAQFDLVFRPVQIFSWQDLYRMARLGARLCYTHQDSIAVRCHYLSGASLRLLHRNLPFLADRIIAISESSRQDFEALHQKETLHPKQGMPAAFEIIYQGSHPTPPASSPRAGKILIVGNRFQHKGVSQALDILQGLGKITVLGGGPERSFDGVERFTSGHLGTAEIADLFVDSAVIVYPSYYEGFGLPVLDGLALGRPVVVIDSAVNRELQLLTEFNPNLYIIPAHDRLRDTVSRILSGVPASPGANYRNWSDVAKDYARVFDDLLAADPDPELLRYRWNWLAAMDAHSPLS